MQSNILILGNGFIGCKVQKELKCNMSGRIFTSYADIDEEIKKYKPKVVINCIGITGAHNVDDCEKDIDSTIFANTYVPILLAEAAIRHDFKLVHISSGCIFHYDYKKDKPIEESKLPDYHLLYYSRTKIYSENVLRELAKYYNILIARIRIPLDSEPSPRNIIDKLLKYKTIIDVPNSVTYIPDFIKALKYLIKIDAKGIFNVVAKGPLRYPDLLDEYRKYHPKTKYDVISLKSLKMNRTNLVLSTKKLESTGFNVRPTKEIIKECVKKYVSC